MRSVSVLLMAVGGGLLAPALPVVARDLGGEATGNWAGASGEGFFFRAALEPHADLAALRIWNGTNAIPDGKGDPDLNAQEFALSAFATSLRLEVIERADSSVLQVITEFADEESEGRIVEEIQFIDFQFTITGYSHEMTLDNFDGPPGYSSCTVDTLSGRVVDNGKERSLPQMDADALNASNWSYAAVFDRGWCSRLGEG
ncbi:hypothetical protein [Pseudogemmobacter bohemicus]|uniref:hypothetical protein n=1 Tax=Pseudogemmobacter bohemicus TaxID=2250708 RepID=UPI001300A5E5|nr:hypothetical protein [Pseudogemmobacter bohemicus]